METTGPEDMPIWVIVLIPIAFFIVFPLFWCFVVWINSHVSGWRRLARRYQSDEEPKGKRWHSVQGRVGLVSYKGVLTCVANEEGLFLEPGVLFRTGHPRLFLPWSEFRDVRRRQLLWYQFVKARIGDPAVATVVLEAKVFEESRGRCLLPGEASPDRPTDRQSVWFCK